jgi:hypothetical protein
LAAAAAISLPLAAASAAAAHCFKGPSAGNCSGGCGGAAACDSCELLSVVHIHSRSIPAHSKQTHARQGAGRERGTRQSIGRGMLFPINREAARCKKQGAVWKLDCFKESVQPCLCANNDNNNSAAGQQRRSFIL